MESEWKNETWRQLGAAVDMLENAMHACTGELWRDRSRQPEFWYTVFHTLFWLDLYLSGALEGFAPPAPFTLDELDPAGVLPDRVYEKAELQAYLDHCRGKCRRTIAALTDTAASRICAFPWARLTFSELLLDTMRHVQHHAAQLNVLLRQETDSAPRWVAAAALPLGEGEAAGPAPPAGESRAWESFRHRLRHFMAEREWRQFHNPKDMAIALSLEASELLEHFLWKNGSEINERVSTHGKAIRDEMADIGIYLLELCDVLDVDLPAAMSDKLTAAARKYPVEKARGSSRKYTELDQE